MEKINCLIVDDEPIAREIIQTYCGHLPALNVKASCGNALEAKAVLLKEPIDLIFLDINMPVLDGIAFLKTLKNPPQIILTTAYKEFALEAFDLAVCDYLLKPFSLERFIVAVDKVMEKLNMSLYPIAARGEEKENYTFLKTDGKIYKIPFEELLYAEANGNYTRLVMQNRVLLPSMSFSSVEELLPTSLFIRVHRSFIINKSMITHLEGNRVFIGKTEIPIGTNYKSEFMARIGLKE
jgi:DNA-binding LytR/AlgR family response regulator